MGMAPYSIDSSITSAYFQRANSLIGSGKKILQNIYFARILVSHKGLNPKHVSGATRF